MPLNPEQTQWLAALARQLIAGLGSVEAAVKTLRESGGRAGLGVFALPQNPMVGAVRAVNHLERIREQGIQDLVRLSQEPFVVHVLAEDASGRTHRLYFARAVPPSQVPGLEGRLASYRAPLGRLAELPVGKAIPVRIAERTESFTVIERARLVPRKAGGRWDGRNDRIEARGCLVTLESLLEFLEGLAAVSAPPEDILAELLAGAEAAKAVRDGVRRRVIDRMSLRDEPTLDQYQGEIFRLPLNQRLMLAGPPGTGKTTTLIRRLAQKRNVEEISESEQALVQPGEVVDFFHPDNWIMFTPTELLKLYLKEAFAREGVAASDERVRSWFTERRRLGRDVFRVLRSEQGGRFTLDDGADILLDISSDALARLADAFVAYVREDVAARYTAALSGLADAGDARLADLASRIQTAAGGARITFAHLVGLVAFHDELAGHVRRLADDADEVYRSEINSWLARDRAGLDKLADFLESLGSESNEDEDDEDSEQEEEVVAPVRDRRVLSAKALQLAIFARSIVLEEGRTIGHGSRNARVLEWLGPHVPADAVLRSLGARLIVLRRLRFLAGTYRNLVDRVPVLYQRFRRLMLREGKWYHGDARATIGRRRVVGPEVDVMLLVMLRHARAFLEADGGRRLRGDTRIAVLETVKQQYVTQVLVDEAPDFSAVELACMLELSHPAFRSFFACGDVRQRVTGWGMRDWSELEWVSPDFEVREVVIGYRQSRRLAELAASIAALSGAEALRLRQPESVEDADVAPILGEDLKAAELAQWVCDRVLEVERAVGRLPSIAVFVDGDDRVESLVAELGPLLREHNLDAVACKEGRVVGTENEIRVFDVQYIKGLEFEAVFFVGIDALMTRYPDLFDKFLFVGVSRAATYLGMTCEGTLPGPLEALRLHFSGEKWG